MSTKPRRPAQLYDEQIEAIEGEADVAYNSELAHTSAQALVPMGRNHLEDDDVRARILKLVETEGVDVIAESWVRSPEDTLPGILWRGYLLREWLRRDCAHAEARYATACDAIRASEGGAAKIDATPAPDAILSEWNTVFTGAYDGHFDELLRDSARFTDVLADIDPTWIESDEDELATPVTRRDAAMTATSREFLAAAELSYKGGLE